MSIGARSYAVLEAIKSGYRTGGDLADHLQITKPAAHSHAHILKKRGYIRLDNDNNYIATDKANNVEISKFGPRSARGLPTTQPDNVLARTEKLLSQLIDEIALLKPMLISPREREDYEQLKAMRETIDNMVKSSKPGTRRK